MTIVDKPMARDVVHRCMEPADFLGSATRQYVGCCAEKLGSDCLQDTVQSRLCTLMDGIDPEVGFFLEEIEGPRWSRIPETPQLESLTNRNKSSTHVFLNNNVKEMK